MKLINALFCLQPRLNFFCRCHEYLSTQGNKVAPLSKYAVVGSEIVLAARSLRSTSRNIPLSSDKLASVQQFFAVILTPLVSVGLVPNDPIMWRAMANASRCTADTPPLTRPAGSRRKPSQCLKLNYAGKLKGIVYSVFLMGKRQKADDQTTAYQPLLLTSPAYHRKLWLSSALMYHKVCLNIIRL